MATIPNLSPVAARAAELLKKLPLEGTLAERTTATREALDTLIREYPQDPPVNGARLAKAVGAEVDAGVYREATLRMGLSAVAGGLSGSGGSLAALALRMIGEAPGENRNGTTSAAMDTLARRRDLSPVLSLRKEFPWFQGSDLKGAMNRQLLEDAAEGASRIQAANHLATTEKMAVKMVKLALGEAHDREESKTYSLARTLQGGFWSDTSGATRVSAAWSFLTDEPHTLLGRAHRLASGHFDAKDMLSAFQVLQQEARQAGSPSWKLMDVAAAAGDSFGELRIYARPQTYLRMGLERLQAGAAPSGQALAALSSDILLERGEYNSAWGTGCLALKMAGPLVEHAPDASWKAAFQLLTQVVGAGARDHQHVWEWRETSAAAFRRVSERLPGRSAFIAAAAESCQFAKGGSWLSTRELADLWVFGESVATEAGDVEAIRQARELLKTQGLKEAHAYLESRLA